MRIVRRPERRNGSIRRRLFGALIGGACVLLGGPVRGEITFRSRTDVPIGTSPEAVAALPGKDGARLLVAVDDGLVTVQMRHGAWSEPFQVDYGSYAKSLATDDFTGDGIADVAYVNRSDKIVTILPGTSAEGFDPPVRIDVGSLPRFLRSAKLGKDRHAAILVAHDDGVAVIDRGPNGGFRTSELAASGLVNDLAVLDRNDDGIPDLALALETEDEIRFQSGDANGGFHPDGAIETIPGPQQVLALDVNSDGEQDLAVIGKSGLAIYLGRPDRRYYAARWVMSDAHISAIAAGDIDRDGFIDLGVTNLSRSTVTFFRGMGDGSFQQMQSYMVGRAPTVILLTDVTKDGVLDGIVLNRLGDSFTQLTGLGNGVFDSGPCILANVEDLGEVASADFDRDSHLDLAITSEASGSVSIFLGQGRGLFSVRPPLPVGRRPRGIVAGQFDPDDQPDLAVTSFGTDEVAVLAGDGRGGFDAPLLIPVGLGPVAIVAGAFGGSKSVDLAVANKLSDSVSILYGDGRGKFPEVVNYPVGMSPSFLFVGDTDGDGKADIVVGSSSSESVTILRNDGTKMEKPEASKFGDVARPSLADDFDGDGLVDLVVINQDTDSIDILPGTGPGEFGPPITIPVGRSPHTATSGDFDDDGRPDIAVVHPEARTVSILLNRTVPAKRPRRMAMKP